MTEKELLNKIKASANEIDIPASVTPESVVTKLAAGAFTQKPRPFPMRRAASAAAALLFLGVLSFASWSSQIFAPQPSGSPEEAAPVQIASTEKKETETTTEPEPKKDAGTLYTVAKSYDEVYERLNAYASYYRTAATDELAISEDTDGATAESSAEFSLNTGMSAEKKSEAAAKDHSSTNLQTEGVDESDIIKTDGKYFYTVTDQKILITDASSGKLAPAGAICPQLGPADSILELYVDNDSLLFIVQQYQTTLNKSEETSVTTDSKTSAYGFLPLGDAYDTNFIESKCSTVLYVYDIKDPSAPVLTGTATQDGFYQTSRKIGGLVYLFTRKSDLAYAASYERGSGGVIPCVNGKEIPYDHIYLPENGGEGLILSSFDVKNPSEAVDELMIVHNYADIYVGNNGIYLYHADYQKYETLTQIAKFSMENGKINAVNAQSVKGELYDTFAINEYQDSLRVLTTAYDRNGGSSNCLYLFDDTLNLTGSLRGLAKGEQIYAARYFGNTAYFITYRNTDPLFAVDLSDPANPRVLSELKITGFSEYLHFWEDGKLLGVGYETDPDSGRTEGLKLVMFDISNPAELKTVDSLVLDTYSYSPALYNYKCVLASPGKNLIGFAAEHYAGEDGSPYYTDYTAYAFENGKFVKKLAERLPEDVFIDSVRGLYIEDTFYIASPAEITGFDMKDGFTKQSHLTLENEQ